MIYAGIDIGKEKHCIAAISETTKVLSKPALVEQNHESFQAIGGAVQNIDNPAGHARGVL